MPDRKTLLDNIKWGGKRKPDQPIVVPEKTRKRARKALAQGNPTTWIDQTLYLIGHNATHHRRGDPLLNEAVRSAESLLALLVEMQNLED